MDPTQAAATANPPAEDYAGRKDLSDLKQAYRASGEEAVRQRARADYLEQQMNELRTQGQAVNPHQAVPQRGHSSAYERLREFGIPADDLREAILSEVQTNLSEALAPIARQIEGGSRARQHMLASYGKDYVQFEQDVAQFLSSDPQVQRTYNSLFQADPAAAVEWGFLKFSDHRRRQHGDAPPNGAPPSDDSQSHARVPSGGGGGPARPQVDPSWDAASAAWEVFQKNPSPQNAERYAKTRIGMVLSDDFVNGTNLRR